MYFKFPLHFRGKPCTFTIHSANLVNSYITDYMLHQSQRSTASNCVFIGSRNLRFHSDRHKNIGYWIGWVPHVKDLSYINWWEISWYFPLQQSLLLSSVTKYTLQRRLWSRYTPPVSKIHRWIFSLRLLTCNTYIFWMFISLSRLEPWWM